MERKIYNLYKGCRVELKILSKTYKEGLYEKESFVNDAGRGYWQSAHLQYAEVMVLLMQQPVLLMVKRLP